MHHGLNLHTCVWRVYSHLLLYTRPLHHCLYHYYCCCYSYNSGKAAGPVYPFGFSMGYFAGESEWSKLPDPAMQAVRCQVLDYFTQQRTFVRDDHTLFGFEVGMSFGAAEARLIGQVCLHMGFTLEEPFALLTGEDSTLMDNYPELGIFRDIVYLLKAVMAPTR
jgi:hypothetical protein